VPIINNLETRLWFYYLAVSYIKIGCEGLHLGQVGLIGADDKDLKVYSEFLAKVRTYANSSARRHMVLMDGHVPSGGMVKDLGQSAGFQFLSHAHQGGSVSGFG
jgi:hypothetical protein